MNVMAHPSSSFEEIRRRHLIEATIEAVADVGFKAASLSQIAKRANVSTSLYAHYFRDKDGLLEATLRFLAARLSLSVREKLRESSTPRERLLAIVNAALGDQEFDRRTSAVWLAFWGQIAHSDRFQRIQYAYQRRLHTSLRHAFRACVPPGQAEHCATVVAGLIDGLWLQSHAYKSNANAGKARETVHRVVYTLIEVGGLSEAPLAPALVAPSGTAVDSPLIHRESADFSKLIERARGGAILWAAAHAGARSAVLERCADLVVERAAALARLDVDAAGRSVFVALEFFVPRCALAFRQGAAQALSPASISRELDRGVVDAKARAFGGVVRAAADRSAPLLDMCRAAARALGAGASLVIDVPHAARAVATALADLLVEAGVPAAAFAMNFDDAVQLGGSAGHSAGFGTPATGWLSESAAVVFGGAAIARAVDAILSANDPCRRTPDINETILFVQQASLCEVEDAAIAWCERTRTTLGAACGSTKAVYAAVSQVVEASLTSGSKLVYGCGAPNEPTILRLRGPAAFATIELRAPILRVVPFESEADLLAMFAHAEFGSVSIFAGDGEAASRIAGAAPAPVCSINAYEFDCERAGLLLRQGVSHHDNRVPSRRLLTFEDAAT